MSRWDEVNKVTLKTPLLLPLRFPGDGVADLRHHPPGSLFGTAHIHLPLHHGPPQPQTSARHHWSTGSSYGELVLCQTSLSDPVNCSTGWCAALWGEHVTAKTCQVFIYCWNGPCFWCVLWSFFFLTIVTSASHADGSINIFLWSVSFFYFYARSIERVRASALYFTQQSGVQLQCMSLLLSCSVSMRVNNTLNCHFTAGQANTVPDD